MKTAQKQDSNTDRLHEIIEVISGLASLDFSKKANVKGTQDPIDVIGIGLNMMGEALEETVVSKSKLMESERKYRALFTHASDAIILLENCMIKDCNSQGAKLLGISEKELIGKNFLSFIQNPPLQQTDCLSFLHQAAEKVKSRGNHRVDISLTHQDGNIIESEVSISEFLLDNTAHFLLIIRDMGEKRKAEQAIRKSREQLEHLIENAPIGMLLGNTMGEIVQVNKAFCHMTGYTAEEILQMTFQDIAHPEDFLRGMEHYGQVIAGEIPYHSMEKRYFRKDGSILHTLLTITLHRDLDDTPYYFSQVVDISNSKSSEQAVKQYVTILERANQELDQFAYVVSHDLKAPLRGIANLTTFIEEDLEGKVDENILHNLEMIKGRVHRMSNLIEGLLEYSRVGKKDGNREWINMQEFLQEIVEMFQPIKKFQVEIQEDIPPLYDFKIGIQQIFENLISNAIKYNSNQNPSLKITYQDLKGKHEFSITDNGPGIQEEYQSKIFDIFQTLQSRDQVESTGIGLSIVKKRLETMGGSIQVRSKTGQGSSFIVLLSKNKEPHQD